MDAYLPKDLSDGEYKAIARQLIERSRNGDVRILNPDSEFAKYVKRVASIDDQRLT